jgi:3-oxoacyl-[acyl-carrier protein] reductase
MMRQRFGRIINIASLSAVLPPMGQTNYAAAKAGVVALTRTLAKETGRAGITVNAVLPGYIETEALSGMDEEGRKQAKIGIPMRRFGKPEEVAAAVFFLASAEASYVTGSSLKIDGGIF